MRLTTTKEYKLTRGDLSIQNLVLGAVGLHRHHGVLHLTEGGQDRLLVLSEKLLGAGDLADLFGVSRFTMTAGNEPAVIVVDLREEPKCERSWKRDGTVKERLTVPGTALRICYGLLGGFNGESGAELRGGPDLSRLQPVGRRVDGAWR